MNGWRSWAPTLALAFAAGTLGLVAARHWFPPRSVGSADSAVRAGEAAPAITLPDLDGRTRTLAEWRGRPLLVNFWASWCAPCVRELPLLDDFAATQPPDGTRVIGIALDDEAAVRGFLAERPVRYPQLLERAGRSDSSVQLGNARAVLPFSVLIDAEGRIVRQHTGAFDDLDQLRTWATVP